MTTEHEEPMRLLEGPEPQTAELARGLLEAEGIPTLLQGADTGIGVWGVPLKHVAFTYPDLFVPGSAFERAREILREAWGEDLVPPR